ncbi:transposase [Nonomuraea terrae]|uniref:transposase n=1 Tax=Nonomuraea terrae TaxID=2530383 RepID=UPI001CB6DA09|nr:transposase [Nonomuraea terrae]
MLARIDAWNADIATAEREIDQQIAPWRDTVERLDEIPGIGPTAAHVIISGIGLDMSRFPTAKHLASWARFAPGVKESAGKKKGAKAPPVTATPTWPASWARPPWQPAGPRLSSANATGASPAAAATRKPPSPSAVPS